MLAGKRIVVVMPAYRAERTLRQTFEAVPRDIVDEVILTDDASDDAGWAHLGEVGSILTKKRPDFDSRNYGYSKLSDLPDASQRFEVRRSERGVQVRRAK